MSNQAKQFMESPYTDLTFIEDSVKTTHDVWEKHTGRANRNEVHVFEDGSMVVIESNKVTHTTGAQTINLTHDSVQSFLSKMYLDYVNNFISSETFARHYGLTHEHALSIISAGKAGSIHA